MPILYACVARGSTVLAEHASAQGNFASVTRKILAKIPQTDGKQCYVYQGHCFHYSVAGGITFLCMTDEAFGRRVPFAFLDDIATRWRQSFGDRAASARAYAMNEAFSPTLQRQMSFFSSDPDSDRLQRVRREVDGVQQIMVQNIDKVIGNQEKIELLVDKTDSLTDNAVKFKKSSKHLRSVMWWKNVKIMLCIGFVIVLVIFIIAASACGGISFPDCKSDSDDGKGGSDKPKMAKRMLDVLAGVAARPHVRRTLQGPFQ